MVTFENGNLVSQTKYKAWGEVRLQSGPSLTEYTYTGQYSHTEDFGLMFYNARWLRSVPVGYDPSLGRFAQADSIVPPGVHPHFMGAGGLDRYAYVNNSPMNYVDPSGHEPKYGDGACYEIDCKNANGTIPRLGNGEGGVLPRINCQNRSCVDPEYAEELSEFFSPVTLIEQMFSVDLTMSGAPSIGDGVEIACSGLAVRAGKNAASCDGIGEIVDVGIDVAEKTIIQTFKNIWNNPAPSSDTNFRTPSSSSTPTNRTPTPIPTSTITPTINTPTRTSMPTSTLSQTPSATLSQPNTYPPSTTPTLYFSTPTYPVNSSTPTYWLTP